MNEHVQKAGRRRLCCCSKPWTFTAWRPCLPPTACAPPTHPYVALLVSHLAPATVDASCATSIFESRTQACSPSTGPSSRVLSPLAEHLLLLMEGIYKDTPEVGKKLNAAALKAFSPISRALAGDGVVSATHIRNMGSSLDDLT